MTRTIPIAQRPCASRPAVFRSALFAATVAAAAFGLAGCDRAAPVNTNNNNGNVNDNNNGNGNGNHNGNHNDQCDDGTTPTCEMVPPVCEDWEILAYQNLCYVCVNPDTCLPWGQPQCATDAECPADRRCDPCGSSSCPDCRDCVAACVEHGCATEPEPACDLERPNCGEGAVAVVAAGCWVCVDLGSCDPAHDPSCDDGTTPICNMPAPECEDWEILAYQDHCYVCVNPVSCAPWGVPGCAADEECAVDEWCNPCGTASCPGCLDCVAACVPHNCPTETDLQCWCARPECGEDGVAILEDGCYICVYLSDCTPMPDPGC